MSEKVGKRSEKVGKISEKVGKPSGKRIFSDNFPMFHPHDGNLQHWQCKFISYASDGIFHLWKWKLPTNFDFSDGFFYSVGSMHSLEIATKKHPETHWIRYTVGSPLVVFLFRKFVLDAES